MTSYTRLKWTVRLAALVAAWAAPAVGHAQEGTPGVGPPVSAGPPATGGPPRGPFAGPPGEFEFWSVFPGRSDGGDVSARFLSLGYDLTNVRTLGRWQFSAKPQFQGLFLDGAGTPAPPEASFGLGVELRAEAGLGPKTRVQLAVAPGLFTDFDNLSGDAFRFPARAIVSHVYSPEWLLLGGVVYTAQPSLLVLPVAGAVWTPSPDWRFELTFPRPRAVYRYSPTLELYAAGALTFNTYAVRASGRDDLFQYREVRAGVGAEWFTAAGTRLLGEAGVAFARRLDFKVQADRDVDPGAYVRLGVRF